MLGDKIKSLRKQNKKTLQWLSEQTDLSVSYLSQLEAGIKPNPTKDTVEKIAKVFNIVPSFFYEEEGTPIPLDHFAEQMPEDIKEWIVKEEVIPYIVLAKEVQESDLSLEDFNTLIDIIRKQKNK